MSLHLSFVESQLATSPGNGRYLCGDQLTAADILMSYPLFEARENAGELNPPKTDTWSAKYPKIWAYLKRLEDEPGFKRAEAKIKELEKGRPQSNVETH